MSVPGLYAGGGGAAGYQTQRSLRLRASASASLSHTPGVAGNRKLTLRRVRIKLGTLGTLRVIASAGTASVDRFYLDSSDRLCLDVLGTQRLVSAPLRRDPTAWSVDVEFRLDVANVTAAQRAQILVDGVELTYSSDSRAGITNTDTNWNNTVVHYWGRDNAGNFFDGYIAEPIGVDGGTTSTYSGVDAVTGQRVAVRPSANYGTTGFYLDFSDPTSLTTLTADSSGNGNNWTANNISLTAGATYDSMLDVPLGGGENERGNYCTWSPIDSAVNKPTNGNLRAGTNAGEANRGSIFQSSGKWYFEFQFDVITSGAAIGIGKSVAARSEYPGFDASGYGYNPNTGNKNNAGIGAAYGATFGTSDIIGVAYDLDNGNIWWSKNGVWQASGDPATGASPAYTGLSGAFAPMYGVSSGGGSNGGHANFGQRPFSYAPPSGFKALHTGNLTSDTVTVSGSFTGNVSADGPFVWMNGAPETLTINGNAVTWGTHADKAAGGFKLRTSSSSYNSSGTNTWTATVLTPASKSAFKYQNAKGNP